MKILPTEFDGQSIRRVYDEATETWWFSVIDVVQMPTLRVGDKLSPTEITHGR